MQTACFGPQWILVSGELTFRNTSGCCFTGQYPWQPQMDHFEKLVKTWNWSPPWTKEVTWHFIFQIVMQWGSIIKKAAAGWHRQNISSPNLKLSRLYLKGSHFQQQVIWMKAIHFFPNEFRHITALISLFFSLWIHRFQIQSIKKCSAVHQ